jgi:hypothetical protein
VDAWAARHQAVKEKIEAAGNSIEVYLVQRTYERYQAAVSEAYAIHWLLCFDPYSTSAHYYYRARLSDAGYSEAQLESVPGPQETTCLHMMSNGVFTCVGKIHKARKAGDDRQWYYCTDCGWTYPEREAWAITREELRDGGIVLIPLDATYLIPFTDVAKAVTWTKRVLLQQGFMMTLASAAKRLNMAPEAVQALCQLGVFHRYEHPNLPQEYALYTREIETYHNEQRRAS